MATLVDSFTGTDGNLNTAGRTDIDWTAVVGSINVLSNAFAPQGTGSAKYHTVDELNSADQYAEISVTVYPTTDDRSIGVRLRAAAGTTDTAYDFEVNRLNSRFTVSKTVAGSGTGISGFVSLPAGTLTPTFTMRAEVEGSTLRMYVAGVLRGTYTDTQITGNRRVGVRGFNCNNLVSGDSFSAGDLLQATAPVGVSAGADVSDHLVSTPFTRTGTATSDGGSAITGRTWVLISAPAGVTTGGTWSTSTVLNYTPTHVGSYTFRYTETNAIGSTSDDMVLSSSFGAAVGGDTRRNEALNPRAQNNETDWGYGGASAARSTSITGMSSTTGFVLGADSFAFTDTADDIVTPGESWTVSVELKGVVSAQVELKLEWHSATGFLSDVLAYPVVGTTAARQSVTGVAPADATRIFATFTTYTSGSQGCSLTEVLIEKASAAGTYFDGDKGGGTWTGTAGNSASTKSSTTTAFEPGRQLMLTK